MIFEISEGLKGFLDRDLKLKSWPSKKHRAKQRLVMEYLSAKFEINREYSKKEVSEILNQHHTFGDPAILQRGLFMKKLLDRAPDDCWYWIQEKV